MTVIEYLRKHGKDFKIGLIEKAAGIQPGMIARVINSDPSRKITDEQEKKVLESLQKISSHLHNFLKTNKQ